MVKIILIEKSNQKECNYDNKNNKNDLSNLFKKCKLKKSEGFCLQNTWKYNETFYYLYGKNKGIKNNINNYTFLNFNKCLYGTLAIVSYKNNVLYDLTLEEWNIN